MQLPKSFTIPLLVSLFFVGCHSQSTYKLKNQPTNNVFSLMPEGQYQISLSYPGRAEVTVLSAKIATVHMSFTLVGLLEKKEDKIDLKICKVKNIEGGGSKIFFDETGNVLNQGITQTHKDKFMIDLQLTGHAETSLASPKFTAQIKIDYPVEAILESTGDEGQKFLFKSFQPTGKAGIPLQNFDVDRVKLVIKPEVEIILDHDQKDKRKIELSKLETPIGC